MQQMNPNAIEGRAYVTIDQAAAYLGYSPCTIRRAIAARRLSVVKLNGRYSRTLIKTADLLAWLERSRIAAVGED